MLKILVANLQRKVEFNERRLRRLVKLLVGKREGEISIAIVGARRMKRLNKEYLGRDGETDVLSFDLGTNRRRIEGEVIVSASMATRESRKRGTGEEDELALYVAHGILHILGMDDATEAEAAKMHRRALKALRSVGYRKIE